MSRAHIPHSLRNGFRAVPLAALLMGTPPVHAEDLGVAEIIATSDRYVANPFADTQAPYKTVMTAANRRSRTRLARRRTSSRRLQACAARRR